MSALISFKTISKNLSILSEGELFLRYSDTLYKIGIIIYNTSRSTLFGGRLSIKSFIVWYIALNKPSLSSLSTEKSSQNSNGLTSK